MFRVFRRKMCRLILFALSLVLFLQLQYISCVNILVLESLPSPSHHIWYVLSFKKKHFTDKEKKLIITMYRIKTLTSELASKGYNVTSLSADVESNSKVHYLKLDGIYEATFNESSENKVDVLEMGQISSWSLISVFQNFLVGICKVTVESSGYKALLDYPDDFQVIKYLRFIIITINNKLLTFSV